ncbi:HNH endonuclease signature motif containing protein [Fulvimarina sp. 2208YS6-2-32]|uniref:HNH endonuclease signature motif containing protein n=1 Tax=Fulvimarina uroteuthidis TaxID=3098149 RepID=UPI003A0FE2DD
MTENPPVLTVERLREVIDYDPATGVFRWRISRPGCVAGRRAGAIKNDGYRQIEIDRRLYRGARLAFLYMTGSWPRPGAIVDHRNRVRDDDRWSNLREATLAQNARNRGLCRRNTSGRIGVSPIAGGAKWNADIGIGGRNIHLGRFKDKADAIAARDAAERRHYGDFAAMSRR